MRAKTLRIQTTIGADRRKYMWNRDQEETPEYIEGAEYTNRQKELMADALLREDARSEMCRECGKAGEATGEVKTAKQDVIDGIGNPLFLEFPEFGCSDGHTWFQGEGEARGIGGDNPILFEEHLQSRRRREIFPNNGTPDPSIVAGIYNRVHPQGRRVNSKEQRERNGASFYR
jgi:hypothetical protein